MQPEDVRRAHLRGDQAVRDGVAVAIDEMVRIGADPALQMSLALGALCAAVELVCVTTPHRNAELEEIILQIVRAQMREDRGQIPPAAGRRH